MNVGEAAAESGVSAKMIRYYESIGLLPPAPRTPSGYRHYGAADLARLGFVRRARDAGFGLAEIGELLALWEERRPSREVRRLVAGHLATIGARIAELHEVAAALQHLVDHCRGDARPECPILDAFAGAGGKGTPARGGGKGRVTRAVPGK